MGGDDDVNAVSLVVPLDVVDESGPGVCEAAVDDDYRLLWRIRLEVAESKGDAKDASYQEQPVVVPQVMHFRQVPLRTMVNCPQSPHGSPS